MKDGIGEDSARSLPSRPELEYQLLQYLTQLYGEGQAAHLRDRLIGMAQACHWQQGSGTQSSKALLITYGDSLIEGPSPEGERQPLRVLADFADAHLQDVFSGIHILPFFPSSSDDGFAVIDYRQVRPDLGRWEHISDLAKRFDVMVDLVINHCSRESLWFADFVGDRSPGNAYFHQVAGEPDLSQVVRPRNTPLLTPVHTYAGIKNVWTTFSEDQVDLNFANPQVLLLIADILFFYVDQGARYLRLDAVAFLWKRAGSSCMSLPETHMVVRVIRTLIDIAQIPLVLITETNVPHEENISYFGAGDEAHMVYQFSLAPLLLFAYVFNDARALVAWTEQLQAPPEGCSYFNFIASHDGIGLRPLEGLMPEAQVQQLIEKIHERGGFAAMRTASDGCEKAYELNVSLFSAFGGRTGDIDAYVGAHQLLMAYQGVPGIYFHALVGTQNDLQRVESTGRMRSINRGQWQRDELLEVLGESRSHHALVFNGLVHSLRVRAKQTALLPEASQHFLFGSSEMMIFLRESPRQRILVVASFADHGQLVDWPDSLALAAGIATDVLTGQPYEQGATLTLGAYQVLWLDLA